MKTEFQYDVFLSRNAKDKAVVRPLAERLRKDGPPAKEEGRMQKAEILHSSFCIHPSLCAFGSDWAQLKAGTFRFRDPLNKERRFVPARLDDAPIIDSLVQFPYINWRPASREPEYAKLLEACRRKPSRRK